MALLLHKTIQDRLHCFIGFLSICMVVLYNTTLQYYKVFITMSEKTQTKTDQKTGQVMNLTFLWKHGLKMQCSGLWVRSRVKKLHPLHLSVLKNVSCEHGLRCSVLVSNWVNLSLGYFCKCERNLRISFNPCRWLFTRVANYTDQRWVVCKGLRWREEDGEKGNSKTKLSYKGGNRVVVLIHVYSLLTLRYISVSTHEKVSTSQLSSHVYSKCFINTRLL